MRASNNIDTTWACMELTRKRVSMYDAKRFAVHPDCSKPQGVKEYNFLAVETDQAISGWGFSTEATVACSTVDFLSSIVMIIN